MSAKHTPGPWLSDKWSATGPSCVTMNYAEQGAEENTPIGHYHGTTRIVSGSMVSVALVTADTKEEAKANVALISAAPELLEALELFVEDFTERNDPSTWMPGERAAIEQARNAIAKAKGQA